MTVPAWNVLAGLPAWQVAELPRRVRRGGDKNADAAELAAGELEDRMLSLASACGEGSPVAFGWVRERAQGPVRIIAAGDGMLAEGAGARPGPEGLVKLGYPSSGTRVHRNTPAPCRRPGQPVLYQ